MKRSSVGASSARRAARRAERVARRGLTQARGLDREPGLLHFFGSQRGVRRPTFIGELWGFNMIPERGSLATALTMAFCGIVVSVGCTTKPTKMTDLYNTGQFAEAAIAGDELFAVLREEDGTMQGLEVSYERDRLWVGLEKAKILSDAGRFPDALEVYTHVYAEQEWLAEIESSYAENPLDPANWDASQFLEDAGQAIAGADQTTYVVQPYEAILAASYASLAAMMINDPRSYEFARQSMTLQGQWQQNLGTEPLPLREAPPQELDGQLAEKNEKLKGFSISSILNLDGFSKARASMAAAVKAAVDAGTASPFIPAASLLNWAAFVKAEKDSDARSAIDGFKAFSGNAPLTAQLEGILDAQEVPDKVLVFAGAGRAPTRDYFSVRLPVIIPNIAEAYYRGVYPFLVFRGQDTRPTSISVAGTNLFPVGSVDAITAQDFSRRELSLWWGPTIRGLLRVIASVALQAADGEKGSWWDLGNQVLNVAIAEAEQADLRMWTSLPSDFFAAVIDRPADGRLSIDLKSQIGAGALSIEVPKGVSLVYIRALEPALATVHATTLIEAPVEDRANATQASTLQDCRDLHAAGRFDRAAKAVASIEAGDADSLVLLLERGTMEQDAGSFPEALQSFDAAVVGIAEADSLPSSKSYDATLSDRVLLRQSIIVASLLQGDVARASDAARILADEHQIHVEGAGPEPIEIDATLVPLVEPFMQGEAFAARVDGAKVRIESLGGQRTLLGSWFPTWVALMAVGDQVGAEQALRAIGWNLDEIDLDLARAMLKRTEAGVLRNEVYVFFEAGLAPVLVEEAAEVEAPTLGTMTVQFPAIKVRGQDRPARLVLADGDVMSDTHAIGSVESVMVSEFADSMESLWRATLLEAVLARQTQLASEQGQTDDDVVAVEAATSPTPDLRSWTTLPAIQQAAIVARPSSGRLRLIIDKGDGMAAATTTVAIPEGPVFLYVRSTAAGNVGAHAAAIPVSTSSSNPS